KNSGSCRVELIFWVEHKSIRRIFSNETKYLPHHGLSFFIIHFQAGLIDQLVNFRILVADKVRSAFHTAFTVPNLFWVWKDHSTSRQSSSVEIVSVEFFNEGVPFHELKLSIDPRLPQIALIKHPV